MLKMDVADEVWSLKRLALAAWREHMEKVRYTPLYLFQELIPLISMTVNLFAFMDMPKKIF